MGSQTEAQMKALSKQDIIYFLLITASTVGSIALGFRLYSKIFPDSEKYLLLVDWFRGQIPTSELVAPWSYRPLTSLLAALFPLDPILSFLIINGIILLIFNYILYLICRQFDLSRFTSFVVVSVYTVSHPSIAYGVAVLVEAGAMLSIALLAYFLLKKCDKKYTLLFLVIGVCFRETVIVMALAYLLYTRDWKTSIPLFVVPGLVYLLNRLIFNPGVSEDGYVWTFHLNNFLVTGSNTLIMFQHAFIFIIPFMLIGLFVLWKRPDNRWRVQNWLLSVGVPLMGIMLFGLFFAAFTSRFIWPLYISFIPLVGIGIDAFLEFFRGIIPGIKKKEGELGIEYEE